MSAVLGILISIAAGSNPAPSQLLAFPRPDSVRNLAPPERRKDKEGAGAGDVEADDVPPSNVVTIRRRIIIRIPLVPPGVRLPAVPGRSATYGAVPTETKPGPHCIAHRLIRGATISERTGVVIVMASRKSYQAGLERGCRPADFQSGFYINPTSDGAVCAGRDLLHARSGANCLITRFFSVHSGR